MPYKNRKSTYFSFILVFVLIKIGLNLLALSHFGFHRDELLHLSLGDHLDWGYKEVPPFIALLAKLTTKLFGNSVFAARIFTTIASGLLIWLTGLITIELGGKRFAITIACLTAIFSPGFAASGYLFQPVIFDQLWWVLSVYLILKYVNTADVKYLYFVGAAIGIGLLTKYTMAFFAIALIVGFLITKQRKLLFNIHVLGAAGVALLIFLPNLTWQFQHHLPVVTHMKTLRRTQLDYISPADFIKQQLLVNGIGLIVWLSGLAFLFSFRLRRYQFIAFAYIAIFLFLLAMNGKVYYLFGAYPMLFAAGGCAFERFINSKSIALRSVTAVLIVAPNLLMFPMVLPVLTLKETLTVFTLADKYFPILHFATVWEDHKTHTTTQDYADMLGWDEMAQKVAIAFHELTPEQQKHTQIFADNYGEAGAIHLYGKQYHLPDVASLSSSFTLWAPENLDARYIIYVDDKNGGNIKRLSPYITSARKLGQVDYPLAREKGTAIYLIENGKPDLNNIYKKELAAKLLE